MQAGSTAEQHGGLSCQGRPTCSSRVPICAAAGGLTLCSLAGCPGQHGRACQAPCRLLCPGDFLWPRSGGRCLRHRCRAASGRRNLQAAGTMGEGQWLGWLAGACSRQMSMTHHTRGLRLGQHRVWLQLQICQHCLHGAWAGLRLSSPVDGVCMLNRPNHDLQSSTQMRRRGGGWAGQQQSHHVPHKAPRQQ